MAYGDFLYKRDNIIGYTGNLKKNPTVYFVREAQNAQGGVKVTRVGDRTQILFLNGHITQHHDVQTNIGRELVNESWSYTLANVDKSKVPDENFEGLKLQETFHQSEVPATARGFFKTPDGFSDFHISRNQFVQLTREDADAWMELAKAITRFTSIKKLYGNVADDYIKAMT